MLNKKGIIMKMLDGGLMGSVARRIVEISTIGKQVEIANQELDVTLESGKMTLEHQKKINSVELAALEAVSNPEVIALNAFQSKLSSLCKIKETLNKNGLPMVDIDQKIADHILTMP